MIDPSYIKSYHRGSDNHDNVRHKCLLKYRSKPGYSLYSNENLEKSWFAGLRSCILNSYDSAQLLQALLLAKYFSLSETW